MSEKLYAVKNDEGKYFNIVRMEPWWNRSVGTSVRNIDVALAWAKKHGGHVVTFVEEPKKVVITKEQAEIVEWAKMHRFPASYIAQHTGYLEKQMMNAYVNGYTVAKEKKYNVKVPHTRFYYWKWKADEPGIDALTSDDKKDERYRFTESEIEHYNLQDCDKEEVTDDAD